MNRVLIDTDILSYYFKGDSLCSRGFIIRALYVTEAQIINLRQQKESHFGRIPGLKIENWKKANG
jgi:predicted nucleic acid-binding protein